MICYRSCDYIHADTFVLAFSAFGNSGLLIQHNPAKDGSCQFISVAYLLQRELNTVVSGPEIRQRVVDFLRDSPHYLDGPPIDFSSCLSQRDGLTVENYLKNMEMASTFGDHITLTAMACIYRVQFVVISSLGANATQLISPFADNQFTDEIPALLVGHYAETQGSHYVSLQKVSDVAAILQTSIKPTTDTEAMPEISSIGTSHIDAMSAPTPVDSGIDVSDNPQICYTNMRSQCGDDRGILSDGPSQPHLDHFPMTRFGKQNRAFSATHYHTFPWIEYSISADAVFCFPCRQFHVEGGYVDNLFISSGLRDWKKLAFKLSKHATTKAHVWHVQKWAAYQKSREDGSVATKLSDAHKADVSRNRQNLTIICDIVKLLARLGIPFRGHDEGKASHCRGNFLEICDFFSRYMDSFHTMQQLYFNCTSPDVQNEIIEICARKVRKSVVDKIREVGFYTIIADEARSSKTEQLSFCVRHADGLYVQERFLSFQDCSRQCDAEGLSSLLKTAIQSEGLQNVPIVAQSYDGAAVMAGHISGVQQRLKVDHPCAMYIHCLSHKLNLVLVNSCTVNRTALGFFNTVDELYKYFAAPGAHDVFVEMQTNLAIRRREIVQQSDTRWACRWKSVLAIKTQYSAILKSLEVLSDPAETRSVEATGIARQMQDPSFVICLIIFADFLRNIHVVHKALQSKDMTLAKASSMINKLHCHLASCRSRDSWCTLYTEAKEFCADNTIQFECQSSNPAPATRSIKTPVTMRDYVVTSTLGQREDITCTTKQQPACQTENQSDVWYRQLYLPQVDALRGQLDMRFSQEVCSIADAVESVFRCRVTGVDPLL